MLRALHVLLVLAALVILAYPVAAGVDAVYGQDVYLLASVNAEDDLATNRALFELTFDPATDGDDAKLEQVLGIYGNVAKVESQRVLVFDDARAQRPPELPEIAWMPAGSAGGEYPVQAETVLFAAQRVTLAGFVAALALLALRQVLVRRELRSVDSA